MYTSTLIFLVYYRVSFREGRLPPLDIFSPPLSEIVVLLFLRSNPFLAPLSKKNYRFAPPWNDF